MVNVKNCIGYRFHIFQNKSISCYAQWNVSDVRLCALGAAILNDMIGRISHYSVGIVKRYCFIDYNDAICHKSLLMFLVDYSIGLHIAMCKQDIIKCTGHFTLVMYLFIDQKLVAQMHWLSHNYRSKCCSWHDSVDFNDKQFINSECISYYTLFLRISFSG